jgi:HEAT repeat protein
MVAKQLLRDDSSAAVNLTRIKTNADPVNLDLKLAVLANAGASFQDKTSAVEALSQIARRGDDKVINAITKLLQEGSSAIRYAAICALPKIVQQGHPPTIAALTVSLENDCHQNRGAAIGALAKLVQKGHRPTIDSLMTVLANDGDSSFVRTSAVEALSHIARRGDDKVINAITKLLQEDCSGGCSTSVVEALSELAIRGNDKVINAITKLLQEGGSAIRYAAICALPKIVQQGHPTTIAALTVSLEDDCHQNRGAAIGALAKLVQKGYRPNLCRAAMRSQRCSQSSDDNNTEEDAWVPEGAIVDLSMLPGVCMYKFPLGKQDVAMVNYVTKEIRSGMSHSIFRDFGNFLFVALYTRPALQQPHVTEREKQKDLSCHWRMCMWKA